MVHILIPSALHDFAEESDWSHHCRLLLREVACGLGCWYSIISILVRHANGNGSHGWHSVSPLVLQPRSLWASSGKQETNAWPPSSVVLLIAVLQPQFAQLVDKVEVRVHRQWARLQWLASSWLQAKSQAGSLPTSTVGLEHSTVHMPRSTVHIDIARQHEQDLPQAWIPDRKGFVTLETQTNPSGGGLKKGASLEDHMWRIDFRWIFNKDNIRDEHYCI